MMFALLSKELQGLRTMIWCVVGLLIFSSGYLAMSELPDAQTLRPEEWAKKSHEFNFILLFLFSVMMGAGLLVRESDEGTLRFLDGLPLSRTAIFVGKVSAALLVIALIPCLDSVSTIVFDRFSRTSVDGPFPWRFVLVISGLEVVAGALLLSMALAISFTRSWFTLTAGLAFWFFLWLRQVGASGIPYIDPYAILVPDLVEGSIVIPWPQIGAHLAATALFCGVALAGFHWMGDASQLSADRLSRNPYWRGLGIGLRMFGPLIWVGALVYIVAKTEGLEEKAEDAPVGEESFGRRETKRYEFLYRTALEKDARPLMDAADDIHDEVSAFLAAPAPPTRLVVDLASPVVSHAAGQTNWTKIRIPLNANDSLDQLRPILAHETTHAFIEQFGGSRLAPTFDSIRSLHEGLATYVETTLFAANRVGNRRRAVAGAWSRGKIPLSLLVDDKALSLARDPNLVYPVGAELAGALIDVYGKDAPARFLRAVGRPKAPLGLKGAALWRDALQFAGMNFERLAATYESRCGEIAEAEKDFSESLPRITGEIASQGDSIVLTPRFSGAAPGFMVCFVEDNEPFSAGVKAVPRRDDGTFRIARTEHLKSTLRFLLGWRTPETDLPVFEPWAEEAL